MTVSGAITPSSEPEDFVQGELMNEPVHHQMFDAIMRTVVLYGIPDYVPSLAAKEVIDLVCSGIKRRPTHAHISFGQRRKTRVLKYTALREQILRGGVDPYLFMEGVEYFEPENVYDCRLSVTIDNAPPQRTIVASFVCEEARDIDTDADAVLLAAVRAGQPKYGFAYDMPFREGPLWFASGVVSSGMPERLARLASDFRDEYFFGKKFEDGYFRDVYIWNCLTARHLEQKVEGIEFSEWVRTHTGRGELTRTGKSEAVWKISAAELPETRRKMLEAGCLMVKS